MNKNKKIILMSVIIGIIIITIVFITYKHIQKANKNQIEQTEENVDVQLGGSNKKPTSGNTSLNAIESQGKSKEKRYMEGYEIIGEIEIPKINLKANILDETTKRALEIAITKIYTIEGINKPGNTVLYGHNYRNSILFSKNSELSVGDKIYIKDEEGNKMTYEIFNKFETTGTDTSFYTRTAKMTEGRCEVTLSTCTNDASDTDRRLILQAREI